MMTTEKNKNIEDMTEYDKDKWDIRKLGIPVRICPSNPHYAISFRRIKQPWLKDAVKKYMYHYLTIHSSSSIHMTIFNLFSDFLFECHPLISSISEFNRDVIEDYLKYLNCKGLSAHTHNNYLSLIKCFLDTGNCLNWEGFPQKELIYMSDFARIPKNVSVSYSKKEIEQMNKCFINLPLQDARLFALIESTGMRVSDACSSTILVNKQNCIKKLSENNYVFMFIQRKTRKVTTIPVTPVIAESIYKAIETSRSKYGNDAIYIFSASKDTPIKQTNFIRHLSKMALDNHLVCDDGSPLQIKGHTFRRTLATDAVNCGYDLNVVKMLLGQSNLSSLGHYYTIHSEVMTDKLKVIIDSDNERIKNMGKPINHAIDEKSEDDCTYLLPLSNGWCSKKIETGICSNANVCYGCSMFHPSRSSLPVYERQLQECELNIATCKINKQERYLQYNEQMYKNLKKIIEIVKQSNEGGRKS